VPPTNVPFICSDEHSRKVLGRYGPETVKAAGVRISFTPAPTDLDDWRGRAAAESLQHADDVASRGW
jgi:hypothetical protein